MHPIPGLISIVQPWSLSYMWILNQPPITTQCRLEDECVKWSSDPKCYLAASNFIEKDIGLNCFVWLDKPRKSELTCRKMICIASCISQRTATNETNQCREQHSIVLYRDFCICWIESGAFSSIQFIIHYLFTEFSWGNRSNNWWSSFLAFFYQKRLLKSGKSTCWLNLQFLNRIMNDSSKDKPLRWEA